MLFSLLASTADPAKCATFVVFELASEHDVQVSLLADDRERGHQRDLDNRPDQQPGVPHAVADRRHTVARRSSGSTTQTLRRSTIAVPMAVTSAVATFLRADFGR